MKSLIFIWILLLGILIFPLFWCFWRYFVTDFERKPLEPQSVLIFYRSDFSSRKTLWSFFLPFLGFLGKFGFKTLFSNPFNWISNLFFTEFQTLFDGQFHGQRLSLLLQTLVLPSCLRIWIVASLFMFFKSFSKLFFQCY